MPLYQLKYLSTAAAETIDVEDAEEAEAQARRRLLFRDPGFAIVDLPEVERAAVIIHHGSMDDVLPTGQALARWIDANGYRSAGYSREVTLNWCPDPEQWVTELQQPIDETGG
jgi:effector-binding domain-containing protein